MFVNQLSIANVRNIESCNLNELTNFNIICGPNGSGKTSFLEAIYFLGHGRAFRQAKFKPVIRKGQDSLFVSGEITDRKYLTIPIAVHRSRQNNSSTKMGTQAVKTASTLSQQLPIVVIDSQSFTPLTGTPQERREFIDWGVFHVKPDFKTLWQNLRKAVRQRNILLRSRDMQERDLQPWNIILAENADKIDGLRRNWIESYRSVVKEVLAELSVEQEKIPDMTYYRGWPEGQNLLDCLIQSIGDDRRKGYTGFGSHRADLQLFLGKHQAAEVLSRGQQKMLAVALRVAQGVLLYKKTGKRCVFLIDDLLAELDRSSSSRLFEYLKTLGNQVFFSCIDVTALKSLCTNFESISLFHVKQGKINYSTIT